MKLQEFEIITDKDANFKVFLNMLKYRSAHTHLDYEISYVMFGEMDLIFDDSEIYHVKKGDICCINPYQPHEFRSTDNVQLLFLQVNPSYFSHTYPQIQNLEFSHPIVSQPDSPILKKSYTDALNDIFELARFYMEQKPDYELKCAGLLNMLFYELLQLAPHTNVTNAETVSAHNRATRMRRITDYIEHHLDEKIMLSDIAANEHLTLTYASHFFKDNFHMTFQEYVSRLRCERARRLMLTTDLTLLDISMSCGFSDPKYFKSGFKKQYGCSPREYRSDFGKQRLAGQQTSMLTTQQILSRQTSLVLLQQYIDQHELLS